MLVFVDQISKAQSETIVPICRVRDKKPSANLIYCYSAPKHKHLASTIYKKQIPQQSDD